ncbi:diguanylate cyclase [Arthrobacter sp. NEB 688]|uniref:GGDEF domain-containing protein n=1 Tax=Arthrobacter sp. NEB 688 TaxID=904039 RepID=UPI001566CD45|nr:diguanylate cyclase [Arthrobacter sp. NEB 688]QKE82540.1 EAL domain-containing protein [Arthrobacter sp. NEB 688]
MTPRTARQGDVVDAAAVVRGSGSVVAEEGPALAAAPAPTGSTPGVLRAALVVLVALCAGYFAVPSGTPKDVANNVIGVLCMVVAFAGARRLTARRRGWRVVLSGFSLWVAGDVLFTVEQDLVHVTGYPVPSDVLYISGYVVLTAGLLRLVRGRRRGMDPTPILEALIVAAGFGTVVGTFLVGPIAGDSTTSVLGRLVATSYPVGDVVLVGVLVRLWASVGSRNTAFRLLLLSLVSTTAADLVWNAVALVNPSADTPRWLDLLWMLGYLAAAAAACSPSGAALVGGAPRTGPAVPLRRRLTALGAAVALPGVTLLVVGLFGLDIPWGVVGAGSIVLSLLVVTRIAVLVRVVEEQAVQLSALARSDGLTGAPNRRTWDHELGRAFHLAEESGGPITVALVDLDHFKRYNDRNGHQAGDRLLREAVAAWSALLRPGELLARYGGEEFGLLLPGADPDEAVRRLEAMLGATPEGQRFSAGVASWSPGAEPAAVVERADRALYDAKHAGRGCVRVAGPGHGGTTPPVFIALQPVVDLHAGDPVGHEALSRFSEGEPEAVFAAAHRIGDGSLLEAAAIAAALRARPPQGYLSVNVSIGALVSDEVRAVLPTDLTGLVIEITEQADVEDWDRVREVVAVYRSRGAIIAVDDWGHGYALAERFMRLRPEVVKLDRGLLEDLEDPERQHDLRTLVGWAESMGSTVCAEGVETAQQWDTLRSLGVRFGQGHLFGRPARERESVDDGDLAAEPARA